MLIPVGSRAGTVALKLGGRCAPDVDRLAEHLIAFVVEIKLLASKPTEPGKHLYEVLDLKAAILLPCEREELLERIAVRQHHEVGEVTSLSSTEDREHLVHRQFQACESRSWFPRVGWEQPRVGAEVEFRSFTIAANRQPGKAWSYAHPVHGQTVAKQRLLDCWQQLIDCIWTWTEEVEIASAPVCVAANDQGTPSCQGEPVSLGEPGDDPCHPQLKWAEHLRLGAATRGEPTGPRVPNLWGKHEIIPLGDEIVSPHEIADVVPSSFAKHLLIDPGTIGTLIHVIDQGTAAPAEVRRQLDTTGRLRQLRTVQIRRHRNRTRRGPEA